MREDGRGTSVSPPKHRKKVRIKGMHGRIRREQYGQKARYSSRTKRNMCAPMSADVRRSRPVTKEKEENIKKLIVSLSEAHTGRSLSLLLLRTYLQGGIVESVHVHIRKSVVHSSARRTEHACSVSDHHSEIVRKRVMSSQRYLSFFQSLLVVVIKTRNYRHRVMCTCKLR